MLVQKRTEFDQMLASIQASNVLTFDTEATGLNLRHGDDVVGIALHTDSDDKTWYVPIAHGHKRGWTMPQKPVGKLRKDGSLSKAKLTTPYRAQLGAWAYGHHIQPEVQASNIPLEWLDDLRQAWRIPRTHVAHNAPFDLTAMVERLGFDLPRDLQDTMSMLSVVNPDWTGNAREGSAPFFTMPDTGQKERGSRGLKWQARLWGLERATDGIDSLELGLQALERRIAELTAPDGGGVLRLKTTEAAASYLWMMHPADVARYASDDTRLTHALWLKIRARIEREGGSHLSDLYNRVTLAVWQMERNGFRFDAERAAEMMAVGQATQGELQVQVKSLTGGMVENPNSTPQVAAYLSAVGVKTETTGKAELGRIRDVPAITPILEYRSLDTILNTYIIKWLQHSDTGHVHPSLNVGGTSTGRLSSSSSLFGNLQNVPRVSAKSKVAPKCLLFPPRGMILVEIDYAALEMRIAAWVAETLVGRGENLTLTQLIEDGADMHAHTMRVSGIYDMLLSGRTEAQWLAENGYDLEKVGDPVAYFTDKIARYKAKTTNFAAVYGAGVSGIMRAVGCSEQEARVLLAGYHKAYPAVSAAMKFFEELALKPRPLYSGGEMANYVRYPLRGIDLVRKYHYYPAVIEGKDGQRWSPRSKAARGAFNSVVQGTGGLIMLRAITRIMEEIGFADFKVLQNLQREYDTTTGKIVPLVTVHDSFVFALRPQDLYLVPRVCEIMADYDIRPKLDIDVSASDVDGSWGETRKVRDMDAWVNSGGTAGF